MRLKRSLLAACAFLFLLANPLSAQDVGRARDMAKDMLKIVSGDIEKNYYDPKFHGLDWRAETNHAREQIDKANSPGECFTAIVGLVGKLNDSHTFFIPPQRVDQAKFGFWAKPIGDNVLVYKLEKNGAAEKAGLQLGDRLATINGFNVQRESYDLMMLYFRLMRPVVRLEMMIERKGAIQPLAVNATIEKGVKERDLTGDHIWELIREEQSEESKADKFLYNLLPGDVGYVSIPEFSEDNQYLTRLLKKIEGSKAVIIDLRNNPGGYTDSLAALASHFQSSEASMADIITRKKTEPVKLRPREPQFGGPLFVLVDAHSMSSSEMFAHYFQSLKKATVIGDNTLGRVNAAYIFHEKLGLDSIVPFTIEISVGRVVFPGGLELEGKGVKPDEICNPTPEDLYAKHDRCLELATKLAQKAVNYTPEPKVEAKN
jgi:C-terminal processing protease CtpA/Prc